MGVRSQWCNLQAIHRFLRISILSPLLCKVVPFLCVLLDLISFGTILPFLLLASPLLAPSELSLLAIILCQAVCVCAF